VRSRAKPPRDRAKPRETAHEPREAPQNRCEKVTYPCHRLVSRRVRLHTHEGIYVDMSKAVSSRSRRGRSPCLCVRVSGVSCALHYVSGEALKTNEYSCITTIIRISKLDTCMTQKRPPAALPIGLLTNISLYGAESRNGGMISWKENSNELCVKIEELEHHAEPDTHTALQLL